MATIAQSRRNVGAALVFLLGAAVFLNYVDRGAIGIAAPKMKDELGLSEEAYGLAFSAFFWIYAPVQLFAGWLCDRFSVYKLMAGGILLWAASTLLLGFVGRFAWLPLFLTKSRGFSVPEMTMLATLGYAVQGVCALGYGHFSDWWTRSGRAEAACRRWMMVASQTLAAAAILGLAFAHSAIAIG